MNKYACFLNIFLILFCIFNNSHAQKLTQVVRGKIIDSATRTPMQFANIVIRTTNPPIGTASDKNGNFRIDKVPIGRHDLQVSFLGYETKVIPELLVSSGKEVVLEVELSEDILEIDSVIIKTYTKKDRPLNPMSMLSARTFSVEEAQRYGGGFDDPARLASSFAGVTSGDLNDNGIIIRGNSPKGLLWRLEGIEIPNPNHFAGMTTFGGGGISALSSLMLFNSDFFTGAFPAEYGNGMSGVFDIKLRTGNNEKYEHAFQVGILGIDFSSEGPLSRKKRSSYLFNYRYSTFAIVQHLLTDFVVPRYQDFCIKINVPTNKAGVFSLWALAADDQLNVKADLNTSKWVNFEDQQSYETVFRIGALGLNHMYVLGNKTYLHSTAAITGNHVQWDEHYTDFDLMQYDQHHIDITNYKLIFTSVLNHKFNSRHINLTGFIVNNLNYSAKLQYAPTIGSELITSVYEDRTSMKYSFFSQSKVNITSRLCLNAGFHSQYYNLNREFLVEPRIGLTHELSTRQSLSLAYGNHSRLEPQFIYFARIMDGDKTTYPNKKLKLTKADHFVFAYDLSVTPDLRLKIEPYIQYLYNVPVIPDSSYSTINLESDWFFTDKLCNCGTGTNIGIDLTLERFLKDGYYYLFTASLFESKYKGGDNVQRNTRYNNNFVFNLLFGKEWIFGSAKNKIFSVNGRLNVMGGRLDSPVINDYPYQKGDEVLYDDSKPFTYRRPNIYHLNISLNYRVNKSNHASIWSIQALNLLGMEEHFGYMYDFKKNKVVEDKAIIIMPSLSYKIEF